MISPTIKELFGVSDDSIIWYKQFSSGNYSLTENVLGGSAEASHLIAESVYILVELCTC